LGECNGNAKEDGCGVCNGDNECLDCDGIAYGPNFEDNCGICDDNPDNDCKQDCMGTWGGKAKEDCAGECKGKAKVDCSGKCDGDAKEDECGICNGPGILEGKCDCDGNELDFCDVCGGTATNIQDCIDIDDNRVYIKECEMYDAPEKFKGWQSCIEMKRNNTDDPWTVLDIWWLDNNKERINEDPFIR